jgi:hypothetical protein
MLLLQRTSLVLALIGGLEGSAMAQARDSIRIVSVSPAGPITRGVSVALSVVVDVYLDSKPGGTVQIGFNTENPNRYRMVDKRTVTRGSARLTFEVLTIPVDWGGEGKFSVYVNAGGELTPPRWRPTASDRQAIAVKP